MSRVLRCDSCDVVTVTVTTNERVETDRQTHNTRRTLLVEVGVEECFKETEELKWNILAALQHRSKLL